MVGIAGDVFAGSAVDMTIFGSLEKVSTGPIVRFSLIDDLTNILDNAVTFFHRYFCKESEAVDATLHRDVCWV